MTADSERKDSDGMHSTVTNNSRITAVTAGEYVFGCRVHFQPPSPNSGTERFVEFYKNASTRYFVHLQGDVGVLVDHIVTGVAFIDMAVGDYVDVRVRQQSGAALATTLSEFSARWTAL